MENVKEDEFVALMDAASVLWVVLCSPPQQQSIPSNTRQEYHAQLQELQALLRKVVDDQHHHHDGVC